MGTVVEGHDFDGEKNPFGPKSRATAGCKGCRKPVPEFRCRMCQRVIKAECETCHRRRIHGFK